MSAVFGLCGIHCENDIIRIDPHLPTHWKKVTLPLTFRGQKLRITLTHNDVNIEAINQLETPLSILMGEITQSMPATGEINIQTH